MSAYHIDLYHLYKNCKIFIFHVVWRFTHLISTNEKNQVSNDLLSTMNSIKVDIGFWINLSIYLFLSEFSNIHCKNEVLSLCKQ